MFRGFSVLFTFGLFSLAAWAVWQASHWPLQASLMAWLIGVPTAILLGIELVREVLGAKTGAGSDGPEGLPIPFAAPLPETETPVDPVEERRRTAVIICWVLGFGFSIWLLGFRTGITFLTFLYLRSSGREGWAMTLGMTAAVWLVTTFFFDCTMHIFFTEGALFDWIGVSSDQFYTAACQAFSGMFR